MHVLTLLIIVGDLEKIIYSICEKGTLYQLRNVINRRNVQTNPKDNVVAANDFLSIITTRHILAATMKLFQMNAVPVDEMWMKIHGCCQIWTDKKFSRCNVIKSSTHILT